VPGGGLSPDGQRFVRCRPGFFLPVKVLATLFGRRFIDKLRGAFERGGLRFFGTLGPLADRARFDALMAEVGAINWVVYAKPPFGGPEHVLEYLARYTHRVAIANSRLVSIEDGKIGFLWKDYRHENRRRVMTLDVDEFIRRFLLHVLPRGSQRVRHYGFLSNRQRATSLPRCRELLGVTEEGTDRTQPRRNLEAQYEAVTGKSLFLCPACGVGRMRLIGELGPTRSAVGFALTAPQPCPFDSS
jgi:hypothetical protein